MSAGARRSPARRAAEALLARVAFESGLESGVLPYDENNYDGGVLFRLCDRLARAVAKTPEELALKILAADLIAADLLRNQMGGEEPEIRLLRSVGRDAARLLRPPAPAAPMAPTAPKLVWSAMQ